MDNRAKRFSVTSGAGQKPVSIRSIQEHLVQRVDILTELCKALVDEVDPAKRAKLMGILQVIQNLDVDEESRYG